jgi:hypothetical protein
MFRKGKKRHSSSSSQSSEISTKSKVGKWNLEQNHKAGRVLFLLADIVWRILTVGRSPDNLQTSVF